jgi:hypothetical protein
MGNSVATPKCRRCRYRLEKGNILAHDRLSPTAMNASATAVRPIPRASDDRYPDHHPSMAGARVECRLAPLEDLTYVAFAELLESELGYGFIAPAA